MASMDAGEYDHRRTAADGTIRHVGRGACKLFAAGRADRAGPPRDHLDRGITAAAICVCNINSIKNIGKEANEWEDVTASMPQPTSAIVSFSPSIGRCRLTKMPCRPTTRACC